MQFGGATNGRNSAFCFAIKHQATHRLLCNNPSPREIFLSIHNHCALRILVRMAFGWSLLREWVSSGNVSQPWRTSNRMRRPSSGKFPKKPSTGVSNNCRVDGASVSSRKGPTLKVIRYALPYAFWELLDYPF
jgi:hypothetical protein